MTKADKILARVAIRKTAEKLLSVCLVEPDRNEVDLKFALETHLQPPVSMAKFLQRRSVLVCEDRQDDSPEYLMLLYPKRPLCH